MPEIFEYPATIPTVGGGVWKLIAVDENGAVYHAYSEDGERVRIRDMVKLPVPDTLD